MKDNDAAELQLRMRQSHGAMQSLLLQLEVAHFLFKKGEQQEATEHALASVCFYLDAVQPDTALLVPLWELLYAIDDAQAGRRNPLLEPTAVRSGTRIRTSELLKMTTGAAAVTMLLKTGESLPVALRSTIAAGLAPAVSAKQLKEFRKNILCGRAPRPALSVYRAMTRRSRAIDPKKRADELLRNLRERLAGVRAPL